MSTGGAHRSRRSRSMVVTLPSLRAIEMCAAVIRRVPSGIGSPARRIRIGRRAVAEAAFSMVSMSAGSRPGCAVSSSVSGSSVGGSGRSPASGGIAAVASIVGLLVFARVSGVRGPLGGCRLGFGGRVRLAPLMRPSQWRRGGAGRRWPRARERLGGRRPGASARLRPSRDPFCCLHSVPPASPSRGLRHLRADVREAWGRIVRVSWVGCLRGSAFGCFSIVVGCRLHVGGAVHRLGRREDLDRWREAVVEAFRPRWPVSRPLTHRGRPTRPVDCVAADRDLAQRLGVGFFVAAAQPGAEVDGPAIGVQRGVDDPAVQAVAPERHPDEACLLAQADLVLDCRHIHRVAATGFGHPARACDVPGQGGLCLQACRGPARVDGWPSWLAAGRRRCARGR